MTTKDLEVNGVKAVLISPQETYLDWGAFRIGSEIPGLPLLDRLLLKEKACLDSVACREWDEVEKEGSDKKAN